MASSFQFFSPLDQRLAGYVEYGYSYRIITDTLIVWTEPDGIDYALSFQDPEGCGEVWNFIQEVQRHMNNGD